MNCRKTKRKKLVVAVSVGIAAAFLPAMSYAEDEKNSAKGNVIEEVVVTGIVGGLNRSLNLKKDSPNFADVISAEDAGKLPDLNVAEALQRITGVTIQRSRGEGDFVSIRGLGPDFVRGTVNGRSVVSGTETFDSTLSGGASTSTGRATNFDIFPSEVINALEVVKSASAEHVEGGLGGVVNVKTARPLTVGDKKAFTIRGTYRDFNEDTDPSVSGLYSFANSDNSFGALASFAYSERTIREDFSRSFGWLPFGSYDTDLDGTADRSDVIVPLSNNIDTFEEDRERLTFNSTLQWSFDDESELVVDFLYSDRDIDHDEQSAILVSLPTAFTANSDGSYQVPASNFVGNTLPVISSTIAPELVSDTQTASDELIMFGINYNKQVGNWKLNYDLSYADASGTLQFERAVIVGDGGAAVGGGAYQLDYNVNSGGFSVANNGTASLSAPGNYFLRNGRVTYTGNDDEELAFQFDAEREINSSLISSVKFGVRYRTREKEVGRRDFDGSLGNLRLSDVPGGSAFVSGVDNILDGDVSFPYSELIFANTQQALRYAESQGSNITPTLDPLGTYGVEEDTYATYVQLNLDGDIAGVLYKGNLGFRAILTQQDVSGLSRPFTIDGTTIPGSLIFTSPDNEAINFSDNYVNVLPNLNLRFELEDDLFLRVAASKSLTRATFQQLSPSLTINSSATIDQNGDGISATASLGNPNLSPYSSTNYDIGLEWYFGEASVLYGGLYYKEIEDFVATVTNLNVTIGTVVFDSVTQPDNQGVAQLAGLELGFQKAYESGFGFIINASVSENDAEFETGGDIDFPGVSDISYNLTGYYDKNGLEARLAYSYRGDYLLLPSDVFTNQVFVEGYGQFDASFSYQFNDNLSVFLEALNLSDEHAELTTANSLAGLSSQFLSDSLVGRRIGFGIRGTF